MQIKMWSSAAWALLLCVAVGVPAAHAEERRGLVLSSEIRGLLLEGGKPVPNVRVERHIDWNKEKYPRLEYSTTDEDGVYYFTELHGVADFGPITGKLHRPRVEQALKVTRDWGVAVLYTHTRNNYEAGTEVGLNTIEIRSDLANRVKQADEDKVFKVPSSIKTKSGENTQ